MSLGKDSKTLPLEIIIYLLIPDRPGLQKSYKERLKGFIAAYSINVGCVKNSLTLGIKAACGKRLFACRKSFTTDTDLEATWFQVYEGEDSGLPKFIQ